METPGCTFSWPVQRVKSHTIRMVLSCLVLPSVVPAADWPQFRGPERDGKSMETGLMDVWPAEGLTPLWVAGGLGTGFSGPAVVEGAIYVTGMVGEEKEGILFAFDLSGTAIWKQPYGPEWTGQFPGTRATPTVDGDRIYLLSGSGRLLCFDRADGAILWSVDLVEKFGGIVQPCGFAESVVVDGNRVLCTPGGTNACLAALDTSTGETVWTTTGFSQQSGYCSPIMVERGGNRLLVTITEKSVVGLAPETGEIAWRHPMDETATQQNHSISPVYEDGMLYVTSGHGTGGRMLRLSPDGMSVKEAWVDEVLNTSHGGVLAVGGHVYGGSSHGEWVCLELKSGQVPYESKEMATGSLTYADGMFYCYGTDGTLALVPAVPEKFEPVSRFKVAEGDGEHWAHPVIANGRLYIRHGDALIAYDIAAPGN